MKLKLQVLKVFVLLTILNGKLFAQTTPPPCGLTPYEICEDDGDGIAEFDLVSFYEFPFCPYNNSDSYYPTKYYETENDAQNDINAIGNPESYTNVIPNSQEIWCRADKIEPGVGSTPNVLIKSEVLMVYTIPSPVQPTSLELCDAYGINDDGITVFDLTVKNDEILGGNSSWHLAYYETESDAINRQNAIVNRTEYVNVSNPQTIYAAVSSGASCFEIVSFDLIVGEGCSPGLDLVQIPPYEQCDDNDDGFNTFDLTVIEVEVLGDVDGNYTITYYENLSNATNSINPITNPSTFTNTSNPQTLYIRAEEESSGDYGVTSLSLFVHSLPPNVINPTPLQGCDNDADGFGVFDLTQKIDELLNGSDPVTYNTTFYETLNDATNNVNVVDSINYNNIVAFEQTIYFRVEDTANGCVKLGEFSLMTNSELSLVVEPTPLIECGYINFNDSDGYAYFDLQSKDEEILNGLNPEVYDVLYYELQVDADMDTNPITSMPYRNLLPNGQTLYVRVKNTETNCSVNTTLDLVIEDCQISCNEEPINIETCFMLSSEVYTFSNENDDPLTLRFNSGSIQGLGDTELNIYGSDGETVIATITNDNSNGDLSNMVFPSDGSSISFSFSNTYACLNDDPPLNFDVFCTNTVGFLKIGAFIDDNTDSVLNEGESYFTNGYFTYEKNNDGNVVTVQTSSDQFTILSENETDNYTVNFYLYDLPGLCYNITIAEFNNVTVANGETVVLDFPIVNEQPCEDLGLALITGGPVTPRPGFSYRNFIYYTNYGLETITSGIIEYTVDDMLTYDYAYDINNGDILQENVNGFTLEFTNLEPGETRVVRVWVNCPASLELGEIVTNIAEYTTTSNDLISENNTSTLSELVTGSYDPNDKMESHGPEIIYSDFITTDEYLYYTIRFQNVGTAEAIFVRIEDELDSQLDETTFQMLRASHDYTVTRTGTSLEWFFDDINLPAEQDDAEGSNGFVYFKIKPKAGYTVNDVIPNTAAIYFDFNAPIITNTFNSTFIEPLSVNDFNRADINIYPNPANNKVKISLNGKSIDNFEVTLIDIQGKAISLPRAVSNGLLELDVKALNSGLYFVQLRKGDQTFVEKLVIE